jgi:hypothetical protein
MQVLTRSYNNLRTGANIAETKLTPATVGELKLLRTVTLPAGDDPRLEAQPLYLSDLRMADGTLRAGVVFVCTMANRVYAFDVDDASLLWGPVIIGPHEPITPISQHKKPDPHQPADATDIDMYGINDRWGILSTPVIDAETKTLYVVNWSAKNGDRRLAGHFLHALDVTSGAVKGTVQLQGSVPVTAEALANNAPRPPGSVENSAGTQPASPKPNQVAALPGGARFDSPNQKQRAALTLLATPGQKTLIIASGKFGEDTKADVGGPAGPANFTHGWVLAVDVADAMRLRVTAAWCPTPTTGGGGIWQAGQGPAADAQGNIYFMTSNGGYIKFLKPGPPGPDGKPRKLIDHTTDHNGTTDFAECFVRLHYSPPPAGSAAGELKLSDWFIPFRDLDRAENVQVGNLGGYDFQDQDLGSAGPVLSPIDNLLMGAGKDGVLYVFDRGNLGKVRVDPQQPDPARYPSLKSVEFVTYFPGLNRKPLETLDFFSDNKTHHLHGSPVIWASAAQGLLLFVHGENAPLRAWKVKATGAVDFRGQGKDTASAFSNHFDAMPGGMLTLSANGGQNGVVWAAVPVKGPNDEGDANKEVVAGVLRAYDAETLLPPAPNGIAEVKLLWDSRHQLPGHSFLFNKFCPPVVADGKVLVTTYGGTVDIYGL